MPPPLPAADAAERARDLEADRAASARSALAAALAELAPADRNVLLLIAWADLSYPEVAEVLGVSVGTVRSRLHRARRVLRREPPALGVAEPALYPERARTANHPSRTSPDGARS